MSGELRSLSTGLNARESLYTRHRRVHTREHRSECKDDLCERKRATLYEMARQKRFVAEATRGRQRVKGKDFIAQHKSEEKTQLTQSNASKSCTGIVVAADLSLCEQVS